MAISRTLAAAVIGAASLAVAAPAAVAQERHELVFSGVFADNDAQTGFLSYRTVLTGSLDDGLFARVDLMTTRFSYVGGSGNRNAARLALMRSMPIGMGKAEIGAGVSFARERNTPPAPGDFSRAGVFVSGMLDLKPAAGHTFNLLAEYDSPDKQVFVRGYYEARFGDTGIGPVAHWVRNDGYRRVQYGLRVAHQISPNAEISLFATTGRERVGGGAKTKVSMLELGLRARF